ncbi:MAG: SDR family oxidoreductase [Deltaproteobacteria bacterium]|nr:SDR family oxidoreductase [Deltaproteobacteria bacterium]MBW2399734.1 SDR family oxidoreductase [Deltaproteobacteria bacterium]MBW2664818.1 SDR family oxidoreductase [Deltaproteobacteria bacterium]
MILEGKVVIVSGVGPGLGREIAAAALRDGARVVIGARSAEKLEKTAAELDPSGERIAAQPTDITDPEDCARLAQTAADRFGGLDAVVQVAAFETAASQLDNTPEKVWSNSFETNVIGASYMVRAAAPLLKQRGGGSIVLIGTQSMWLPQLPQLAYASSKGALLSAMYYMAKELGPDKIRVNMVVPTWMWGPPVQMYAKWQAAQRKVTEQEIVDEITANMPLGEIPADDDVAESVIFFCSDRARMITGQSLMVNAGELMR